MDSSPAFTVGLSFCCIAQFPKGEKEIIEKFAEKYGESLKAYINRAIQEQISRDKVNETPTDSPQAYEDWFQMLVNLKEILPADRKMEVYQYSGELRAYSGGQLSKKFGAETLRKIYDVISRN